MCSKEWFIFLYFRSQKTAHFQKQSGLNAQLSGMSLTGLAAGQIIGFSTNPRTILNYKNDLAKGHPSYVCEQLSKSLEVWQFFNYYYEIITSKIPSKCHSNNISSVLLLSHAVVFYSMNLFILHASLLTRAHFGALATRVPLY